MKSVIQRIPKWGFYFVAAGSLCVIAASALSLATRASANPDPFQGISAAESAPVVSPNAPVLAQMRDPAASGSVGFNGGILSAVRQLPSTIAGHSAYAIPTTSGDLCLFVEQLPEACDSPFTASMPVLFVEGDPDGPGPIGTTAFGIAEDGVTTITMTVNGNPVTVRVQGNVFEFSGGSSVTPSSITDVTANFQDGHSVTLG